MALSSELSTATMKERAYPLLARQAQRRATTATRSEAQSVVHGVPVRCVECGHREIRGVLMQGATSVAAWAWCCNFVTFRNVKNHVRRATATSVKLVGLVGGRSLKPATAPFGFDVVDLAMRGRVGSIWQAGRDAIRCVPSQARHALVRENVLPGQFVGGIGR